MSVFTWQSAVQNSHGNCEIFILLKELLISFLDNFERSGTRWICNHLQKVGLKNQMRFSKSCPMMWLLEKAWFSPMLLVLLECRGNWEKTISKNPPHPQLLKNYKITTMFFKIKISSKKFAKCEVENTQNNACIHYSLQEKGVMGRRHGQGSWVLKTLVILRTQLPWPCFLPKTSFFLVVIAH